MNPALIAAIIILLIIIPVTQKRNSEAIMMQHITKRKKTEDREKMKELATRFIDKDCLIYLFNGAQVSGTVKEVCNGAIFVESNSTTEAINLDFIVRLREHPKDKKGNNKKVVLD